MADVSREEILHIAKLANLELKEEEVDTYLLHLQDMTAQGFFAFLMLQVPFLSFFHLLY